ncbi:MAG: hypothetical protein RM347_004590 [Nostoc sp. ChiQUE02]|nr:hypothetical protein [Nostoc sp. ChiQUE02]
MSTTGYAYAKISSMVWISVQSFSLSGFGFVFNNAQLSLDFGKK